MKKFFLLLFAATICCTAKSQDTVYFAKNTSANSNKQSKRSKEANIIKIAPLSFIAGYIPLYYEKELNSFLSIQVGGGITTRNYIKGWLNNMGGDDNNDNLGETKWNVPGNEGNYNMLDAYDYTRRKADIGYYFSVQPRIYFESEGMSGSYVALSYDYYNYASSQKRIVPGPGSGNGGPVFSSSSFKEFEKFSDVMASFGTQTLYDRIALDYSFGIGLRNVKSQHYAYTDSYNSGGYIDGVMESKKTKLAFNLSIKVGYHF